MATTTAAHRINRRASCHSFHFSCAIKGAKATGGTRHGDHQERQPRAIRNRVHRMQRFTDCTETLVARRGAGSLSFLVLRKLRSRLVGGCDGQCSQTARVGAATILNVIFFVDFHAPISHEALVQEFNTWMNDGAPCPGG